MVERSRLLMLLAGVALGAIGTMLLTASSGPPAQAQAPAAAQPAAKPAESARYQISSWGVGQSVGGKLQVANGAYIIDTHTGEVFSVTNDNRPKPVGSVVEKK